MKGIVTLLARFPSYPARKVRRLAKQLDMLEAIDSVEVDGIQEDLMELNLMQAERMERGPEVVYSGDAVDLSKIDIRPIDPSEEITERVVPLDSVIALLGQVGPEELRSRLASEINNLSFISTRKVLRRDNEP